MIVDDHKNRSKHICSTHTEQTARRIGRCIVLEKVSCIRRMKKMARDTSEKRIKNKTCSNGRCYLHDTLSHKVTASK
jgi:hypothetical protein